MYHSCMLAMCPDLLAPVPCWMLTEAPAQLQRMAFGTLRMT